MNFPLASANHESRWSGELQCKYHRRNGDRCALVRVKGDLRNYCHKHGSYESLLGRETNCKRIPVMAKFYGKYVTKSLGDILDAAIAEDPSEQLNLVEEIALIREVAGQAVALYSAARELVDNATPADRARKQEMLMNAGEIMKMQISEVVKTCESAAKISAMARDKISIHQLQYFVSQITRCAFEAFKDDPRAHDFNDKLLSLVKIPMPLIGSDGSDGTQGTTLTPDADAREMDSSVPDYGHEILDIAQTNGKVA